MNIEEKRVTVEKVKEKFQKAEAFFITHNLGLKADEMANMRKLIRDGEGEFNIIKNTLLRLAVKDTNIAKGLEGELKGPTGVAFSYKDPVSIAKTLLKVVDESKKFEVISGFLGEKKVDQKQVIALSKLPGREELIAKTVRTIAAPLSSFLGVLSAVPRDFLNVLTAIKDKK